MAKDDSIIRFKTGYYAWKTPVEVHICQKRRICMSKESCTYQKRPVKKRCTRTSNRHVDAYVCRTRYIRTSKEMYMYVKGDV